MSAEQLFLFDREEYRHDAADFSGIDFEYSLTHGECSILAASAYNRAIDKIEHEGEFEVLQSADAQGISSLQRGLISHLTPIIRSETQRDFAVVLFQPQEDAADRSVELRVLTRRSVLSPPLVKFSPDYPGHYCNYVQIGDEIDNAKSLLSPNQIRGFMTISDDESVSRAEFMDSLSAFVGSRGMLEKAVTDHGQTDGKTFVAQANSARANGAKSEFLSNNNVFLKRFSNLFSPAEIGNYFEMKDRIPTIKSLVEAFLSGATLESSGFWKRGDTAIEDMSDDATVNYILGVVLYGRSFIDEIRRSLGEDPPNDEGGPDKDGLIIEDRFAARRTDTQNEFFSGVSYENWYGPIRREDPRFNTERRLLARSDIDAIFDQAKPRMSPGVEEKYIECLRAFCGYLFRSQNNLFEHTRVGRLNDLADQDLALFNDEYRDILDYLATDAMITKLAKDSGLKPPETLNDYLRCIIPGNSDLTVARSDSEDTARDIEIVVGGLDVHGELNRALGDFEFWTEKVMDHLAVMHEVGSAADINEAFLIQKEHLPGFVSENTDSWEFRLRVQHCNEEEGFFDIELSSRHPELRDAEYADHWQGRLNIASFPAILNRERQNMSLLWKILDLHSNGAHLKSSNAL